MVLLGFSTVTLLSGGRGAQPNGLLLLTEGMKLLRYCGIPSMQLTGVAAVTVSIRAYNATGELDIGRDPFTLGTRVLLTCDVTELPEGSEVVNYKWYHKCTQLVNSRCEIRDGDAYYRVVEGTLLTDVTSLDQGGRYYCNADFSPVREAAITRKLPVAG